MGPTGSKFCPATNQQTLGKGESENNSLKIPISYFFHGRPKLEYETMYDLFASLKVLNNSSMHWSDFVGWTFATFMYW
jgi:hypothetical protein